MPPERLRLDTLPRPASDAIAVRVQPRAEQAIRRGHPWVWEGSIRSMSREGAAGDTAVIFDRKDRFLAVGLLDPEGAIRVRILRALEPARVGPELFRERFARALERRAPLASDPETTGWRLVNGEGDALPGLVVDRYGDTLVVQLHSASWIPHLPALVEGLLELSAPAAILALASRTVARAPGTPAALAAGAVVHGEMPTGALPFVEHGLHFEAHPFEGHKTGFYLDQRENRAELRGRAGGARVLNLFSYSGGFSVAAAAGGARSVVSVDVSGPALRQAERHIELNRALCRGVRHSTVEGDVFEVMRDRGRGERFDVVVVDPPSFARRKEQREGALAAYGSLTKLALGVLEPGGLLVQASCTARVEASAFFAAIHEAARAEGRPLVEELRTAHPLDHPAAPPGQDEAFVEGRYLKCLYARG